MLPEKKWEELSNLIELGDLTSQSVLNVVCDERMSNEQILMMTFAQLTCGEVKIILDCCREAGKLPFKERLKLSQTPLKDRLYFLAVRSSDSVTASMLNTDLTERVQSTDKIGEHDISYLNLCSKCENLWRVFEGLDWAVLLSGVDISAIEKLDSFIQK